MEIKNEKQIYLYGKFQNPKNDDDLDKLIIYVKPQIFDKVPLSSLEGFFIADESRSKFEEDRLSFFVPQFSLYRDIMNKVEERFNGKFFPFEK